MGFDNYGRKFAGSNSDHLQFWVYEDRYATRNPFYRMPPAKQSIAADGGAAEVYRISPDEPWRIIRTRWRIGGLVRGPVEGGARQRLFHRRVGHPGVSRRRVWRRFRGQLLQRRLRRAARAPKKIHPNGVSPIGRRPDDEQTFEFAASRDTWVRTVNFANAPDGTLHICDMYREVIEHPSSIPEEIKKHLDFNSGNDRGRIYRIVPDDPAWRRRTTVSLGKTSTGGLVASLEHRNGWHRDTAARLLYERQDQAAVPLLATLLRESKSPLAKHHARSSAEGGDQADGISGFAVGEVRREQKRRNRRTREDGACIGDPAVAQ